jgi:hypothetical protein
MFSSALELIENGAKFQRVAVLDSAACREDAEVAPVIPREVTLAAILIVPPQPSSLSHRIAKIEPKMTLTSKRGWIVELRSRPAFGEESGSKSTTPRVTCSPTGIW